MLRYSPCTSLLYELASFKKISKNTCLSSSSLRFYRLKQVIKYDDDHHYKKDWVKGAAPALTSLRAKVSRKMCKIRRHTFKNNRNSQATWLWHWLQWLFPLSNGLILYTGIMVLLRMKKYIVKSNFLFNKILQKKCLVTW